MRLELEGDALVVLGGLEVRLHLQVGHAVGPHLVHADARTQVRRLKEQRGGGGRKLGDRGNRDLFEFLHLQPIL